MATTNDTTDDPLLGEVELSAISLRRLLEASGWTAESSSTLGHQLAVRAGVVERRREVDSTFNSAI